MTIQERAKDFTIERSLQSNHRYDYKSVEEGYIKGATDQHKIDIGKALKVYEDLMTCSGYFPETITAELARMRNKLED